MARLPQVTLLVLATAPLAGCDTSMPLAESWGLVDGPEPARVSGSDTPSGRTRSGSVNEVPAELTEKPQAVPDPPAALSPEPAVAESPDGEEARAMLASAPELSTTANPPSPTAPLTLVAVPPLPTSLPPDAVRLTGREIPAAFANMRESYISIDMAGFMAEGAWLAETMSVTWMKDTGISGHLAGAWQVEDDRLCITYRSGYRAPETECLAIYRYPPGYLSTNPDGSLHGYHELTPR